MSRGIFSGIFRTHCLVAFLSFFVCLVGCKSETESTGKPAGGQPTTAQGSEAKADNPDFPEFHSHTVGRKGGPIAVLGRHQFHAEFLTDAETGQISVLLYDDHFMPVAMDAKDLALNIMVGGEPKQYTFPVIDAGSGTKVAVYQLTDPDLAKLLKDGWEGKAQVSITEKGSPTSGTLYNPKAN